jgi:hypothetical protein
VPIRQSGPITTPLPITWVALKRIPIKEYSRRGARRSHDGRCWKRGEGTMPRESRVEVFYLIVTDKDNGAFSVGGQ